jgi:hypothetical protein
VNGRAVRDVRLRPGLERRLGRVRAEVISLREELRILDEQVSYQSDVAGDATGRAVVSEPPLAERERRTAEDDAARVRRNRDEVAERLHALVQEQDRMLERLHQDQGAAR